MIVLHLILFWNPPRNEATVESIISSYEKSHSILDFLLAEENRIEQAVKAKHHQTPDPSYIINGETDPTLIPWQNTLPLDFTFREALKDHFLKRGFSTTDWSIIQKYRDPDFVNDLYQKVYETHLTQLLCQTELTPYIAQSALTINWPKLLNSPLGKKIMTDDATTHHFLVLRNLAIKQARLRILANFLSELSTPAQQFFIRYHLETRVLGTTVHTTFDAVTQKEIHHFQNSLKALKHRE